MRVDLRNGFIAVSALSCVFALAGCGSSSTDGSGDTGNDARAKTFTMSMEEELAKSGQTVSTDFCGTKEIVLGIHDGFGNNEWSIASMAAVRSEAAKCKNVKEIVDIGEGDLQKSIAQVNSLVAQGVNALVLIPDWGEAQLASIKSATNAGVKVVPWGADPSGDVGADYVTYVDWSAPDAGTLWAEWMVKALNGKGNVIFLGGPAGNPVTTGQLKSAVEVFEQHPEMKLLTGSEEWAVDNWDPGQTQQVTAALLAKYPQIDGIISDYGSATLAALRALQTANRDLVPVATLDTNGLGCLYAEEKAGGKFQLATISSRNWLGRVAARKAISAATGVTNDEPSTYALPLIEDSLNGLEPKCLPDQPEDSYNSSLLSPEDITKYGTK